MSRTHEQGGMRRLSELAMDDVNASLAARAALALLRGSPIPSTDQDEISSYAANAVGANWLHDYYDAYPALTTAPLSSRKVAKAALTLLTAGEHGVFPALLTLALYVEGWRRDLPCFFDTSPDLDTRFRSNPRVYKHVFRCAVALVGGETVRREDHQALSTLLESWDGWRTQKSDLSLLATGTPADIAEQVFDYLAIEELTAAMVLLCLYLDEEQTADDEGFHPQAPEACQ